MVRWSWFLAGLAACGGVAQEDFAASRAEATCARKEQCALGDFERDHSSRDDCVGDLTDAFDEEVDAFDEAECEFDPDEAGRCVSRIRGLSCEEYAESEDSLACDLVWICDF